MRMRPPPGLPRPQVCVRLSFGIDASNNVAMKLVVRADSQDISDAIHTIIQDA